MSTWYGEPYAGYFTEQDYDAQIEHEWDMSALNDTAFEWQVEFPPKIQINNDWHFVGCDYSNLDDYSVTFEIEQIAREQLAEEMAKEFDRQIVAQIVNDIISVQPMDLSPVTEALKEALNSTPPDITERNIQWTENIGINVNTWRVRSWPE